MIPIFLLISLCLFTVLSNSLPVTDYPFNQVPFLINSHKNFYSSLLKKQTDSDTDIQSNPKELSLALHNIHSHNDYWRLEPLFTALELGIPSVEADVWSFKTELGDPIIYVGHKLLMLNGLRTLQSLYIDPIYKILDSRNTITNESITTTNQIGIFENHPDHTLYLWIDFKTEGNVTYDVVHQALEPLRSRGWLTTFDQNTQTMKESLVTVIGSGNIPLHRVLDEPKRDIFFDAPLGQLTEEITPNVSPFASASIKTIVGDIGSYWSTDGLNQVQYDTLTSIVEEAHLKGFKTRIWDTPTGFYYQKQINIWEQILKIGSDFLNADDLELAVNYA